MENVIPVGHFKPNISKKDIAKLYEQMENLKILMITPERIRNETMLSKLDMLHSKNMIARLVIDEVHCISKWGHNFRPAFRKLD